MGEAGEADWCEGGVSLGRSDEVKGGCGAAFGLELTFAGGSSSGVLGSHAGLTASSAGRISAHAILDLACTISNFNSSLDLRPVLRLFYVNGLRTPCLCSARIEESERFARPDRPSKINTDI